MDGPPFDVPAYQMIIFKETTIEGKEAATRWGVGENAPDPTSRILKLTTPLHGVVNLRRLLIKLYKQGI